MKGRKERYKVKRPWCYLGVPGLISVSAENVAVGRFDDGQSGRHAVTLVVEAGGGEAVGRGLVDALPLLMARELAQVDQVGSTTHVQQIRVHEAVFLSRERVSDAWLEQEPGRQRVRMLG